MAFFLQFYNAESSAVEENNTAKEGVKEKLSTEKYRDDNEKDHLSYKSLSTDDGVVDRGIVQICSRVIVEVL